MNRPHDPTIAQAGPQDDAWEMELESAFFDPSDDGFDTVDAAPERVESAPIEESIHDPDTIEREGPVVVEVPIDESIIGDVLSVAPLHSHGGLDDEFVIQVVPRWVWPTVGLMAVLAVGGTAFGLGAIWATGQSSVVAPASSVAASSAPLEPTVVQEAAIVPPVQQHRARAKKPRPLAPVASAKPRRARRNKPRPLAPAPQPTSLSPHVPTAAAAPTIAAVAPTTTAVAPTPPPVAPKVPPTSISDLPSAVSLGALKPGAAL